MTLSVLNDIQWKYVPVWQQKKKFNFLDLHKQLKATLQFDTFMCA